LLLRYTLSFAVFISHFNAAYGRKKPGNGVHSIGWYAVNGFFLLSGILVSQSFLKRNVKSYLIARASRILPGYILALIASLGAVLLFQPLNKNIIYHGINFVGGNLLPFHDISNGGYSSAWEKSSITAALNMSLWTIPFETFCYTIIVPLLLFTNVRKGCIFIIVVGFYFACNLNLFRCDKDFLDTGRVLFFFTSGVGLWLIIDSSGRICKSKVRGALILGISLCILIIFRKNYVDVATDILVFLVIIFSIYFKDIFKCLKIDFSYGIYLYAWPLTQISTQLQLPFLTSFILCACLLIAISIFSCKYFEGPALKLKKIT